MVPWFFFLHSDEMIYFQDSVSSWTALSFPRFFFCLCPPNFFPMSSKLLEFIFWPGASCMFCFCVGFPFFKQCGFSFYHWCCLDFWLTDLSFANFRVAFVFLCVLPLCFWLVAGGAFSLLIVATWCGSYMGSFSWSFESCTFFRFPFRWIWGWKTFFFRSLLFDGFLSN